MRIKNYIAFLLFYFLFMTGLPGVNAQTIRIMPLGNSITAGNMCMNGTISDCIPIGGHIAVGYRLRLMNLLTSAGYNIDFVGTETFGNALMADSDCAGFGGISDGRLADIMETGSSSHTGWVTDGPYMNSNPADIVLLHIGTNDILAADTSSNDVNRILNAIDNYESSHGTSVMVFLARIISTRGDPCNSNPRVMAYNRMMEELAASRQAAGDHLILVDMECGAGLDYDNDLMDEVHPNQNGYDKMGEAWFNAISSWIDPPDLTYMLNMETPTGNGSVSPAEGTHEYTDGTEVSLSASPAAGYEFSSWTGDLESTQNPALVTMNGDKNIRAVFTKLRYELTVLTDGSPGASTFPEGSIFVDHGERTSLEVLSIPEAYMFDSWQAESGSSVSITDPSALKTTVVLESGDATIRAYFKKNERVLAVSIPDAAHIIGDTVKAEIHVFDDQGTTYQLVSGEIGNYPLENLQRSDSGLYIASFIVYEGGNNYQREEDIPVSNLVLNDGQTPSFPYNDYITQDHDPIDASAPNILSMNVPSLVFVVGDTIEMTILADGEFYQAINGTVINGVDLESGRLDFSEAGGGEYRLSYVIAPEDKDVASGELEALVLLKDDPGNMASPYTEIQENSLVISIVTDIESASSEKAPRIFPNPAGNYLEFNLGDKNSSVSRIEILDMGGRSRLSLKVSDDPKEFRVDISHLEPGAYLVRFVTTEGSVRTDQFTKGY